MIRPSSLFRFVFIGLLIGLVTSCLEDINLDTGERILNVYCVLGEGSQQELELSYIAPTGGTSQPVGEGAAITLYEEGSPVGQFARVSETRWKLDFAPQSGRTYQLEVKVPGEETLSAETTFPPVFLVRSVAVIIPGKTRNLLPFTGLKGQVIDSGFELDTASDLVLWCSFESRDPDPSYFKYYLATDHPGADKRGETICPFDVSSPMYDYFFRNQRTICNGVVYSSEFYGETPMLHEKAVRIVHPASFSRALDNEKVRVFDIDQNNPLIDINQVYLSKEEMWESRMFGIGGVSTDKNGDNAYLSFHSVSEEYDKYLSDYYFTHLDSDDFTLMSYKRNHYSNVRNGTGIFGASYAKRLAFDFRVPLAY